MRAFLLLLAAVQAFGADPTLIYFGTWPRTVVVMDEAAGAVVERIPMETDVPRTLIPTRDKSKLIAITVKDAGIETIDLATRKVVDSFALGSETKRVRLNGAELDPAGRYLYVTMDVANKLIDRFEIEKPAFAIVDLQEKAITRQVELPKEVAPSTDSRRGSQMRLSPDGKYLWFFKDNIYIVDTEEFKIVETIPLEKPVAPGMESVSLSEVEDPYEEPGKTLAIFNSTDPVVRRKVFGLAEIDLNNRKVDFTPIGPAIDGANGTVHLSPDRKFAYGVLISGEHGDRYCELIRIDVEKHEILQRRQFPGRTRFRTTLTTDGKYVVVYGAGYTLELFDAESLQLVKTIDVDADMTSAIVPIVAASDKSASAR